MDAGSASGSRRSRGLESSEAFVYEGFKPVAKDLPCFTGDPCEESDVTSYVGGLDLNPRSLRPAKASSP